MGDTINGRTPEEIKRNICSLVKCEDCPYEHESGCEYADSTLACQTTVDAIALIEHLEAQIPKWISVEERLPEGVYECVVRIRTGSGFSYTAIASYYDARWMVRRELYDDEAPGTVTHWMPIYEYPEEEKK